MKNKYKSTTLSVFLVLFCVANNFRLNKQQEKYFAQIKQEIAVIPTPIKKSAESVKNTKDEEKQKSTMNNQKKELKKNDVVCSRGNYVESKIFIITYYTDLKSENSAHGGVNCKGKKLKPGMVANNRLQLGTKIYLEGYGEVVVSDRGGKSFNNINRLDVFIPRKKGESDREYYIRVNNMGTRKVKGYILKS